MLDEEGRLKDVHSLISFRGVTTSDGAGDGSTAVCLDLPATVDYNGNQVIITSGTYKGQTRGINGVTTGGTITPSPAFDGKILSGVSFVIVGIRTTTVDVADIEAKLDLPAADETDNTKISEVVGNKEDAANETADEASIIGLLRAAITNYLNNGTFGLDALKDLIDAITPGGDATEAKQDAIEAKLDHADHGLAALKILLDAILLDTGTTLEAKLDAIDALVDAVEVKLDSPDDFKADVSALALEATLTAIEAKLDHSEHGLEELGNRQLLYKNVLYADANPAVGSDVANDGSRESPFLTIVHAVSVASEYTTIRAVDSRTGAAAIGFDENAAIAGVVINTNYITVIGCKLFGDRCFGKNVPITNSIVNADYVFSGSGIGVVVCGFAPILANANADEKCIYLTGDGACAVHCDVSQSAGAHGFIGIHLTGDDVHIRRCHGRWFDNDVVRLEGCTMGHVEESLLGAGVNGVHLMTGCLGCVVEHCDIITNTVGVLVDAGATNNHICMPHFSNNGTDLTNNGGATNDVIDAHKESQIVAGQTIEEDLKDIYDKVFPLPADPADESLIEAAIAAAHATTDGKVDDIETKLDTPANFMADVSDLAGVKTETDKIPTLLSFKDQWCAAPTASWALTNAGQDLSASNVVFPTGFLPSGATVQAIYLMFKWRKQKDSSSAENKISAASKTIRVMKNGATWGTNDIVAITFALNQLLTDADAVEGGDMIIGDVDVKAEIDDVDNETYNVATHNGDGNNDGLVVTAASLTIFDIYVGMRVFYLV